MWIYDFAFCCEFGKMSQIRVIVSICISLADYLPVCWWKLWRMWSLAGTSGTLALLVLVTTDMVGSKICSLRSTSIFSLPHLVYNVNVYFQRFLQTMFSHLWYPVHPHPHPIIARSSGQPELEWCSLKPQNLRVLSQLQSCWRLIELTSHCWTSCLYRIKSHSHLGTYIITGTGPIPPRGSFIQQAILYIYSQVAKKEWM